MPVKIGGEMSQAVKNREEYRRYAAQCIHAVQQAKNPGDKAMLLEMAERWRELAEKIERTSDNSDDFR